MDPVWATFPNLIATIMSGIVLESLRRFSNRLVRLENADNDMAKELAEHKQHIAREYITRAEVQQGNKDLRQDMEKHHQEQMVRFDKLAELLEHRLERIDDQKMDKRGDNQ